MRGISIAVLLLVLAASQASAARARVSRVKSVQVHTGTKTLSGYDEYSFIGWGDACSAALEYYSFPPTGTALQGIPDKWRIGTLSVKPGEAGDRARWISSSGDKLDWDRQGARKAVRGLREAGYDRRGHTEIIRPEPVAEQPGLAAVIKSTAAFEIGYRVRWPPARYALDRVLYSPLGTCVLAVFRDESHPRSSYFFRLVRILNPGLRRKRARAHVSNALLLFRNRADLTGSLEELAIAASTDPDYPLGLYHYSRLLALHGRYDEAMDNLEKAVSRDPSFRRQAERADEFEPIKEHRRFRALVEGGRR